MDRKIMRSCFLISTILCAFVSQPFPSQAQDAAGQAAIARRIGAIKSINGNALTLTPDSGSDVAVTIQPNARMLKIAPGAKDLKDATPVQLQDLQLGDRVRVRGQASADGNSLNALEVIVMAHSDLEARHEKERQDWQKRGLGGLVSSVDLAAGTVSISVTGVGGKKTVVLHTTKATVFRRYAPDSVKFDDAKSSTLQEIQPGDQARARGDRSADGSELAAEEIVTGSFRNVAGTINAVDASAGTVTVQDLLSKKAVQIKVTPESQLRKLPAEVAQMIAMRLKGSMPAGMPGTSGTKAAAPSSAAPPAAATPAGNGQPGNGGIHNGRTPDFQQMLSRMPTTTVADLHKGDAVLIVATQGSSSSATAITLLSGVEPILQAAPSAGQAMMLAPWTLGGAPGGDAMQ